MKNLKSILALLVLTVFSVNVWGEDLNVNYDFTQASTYPSGFPTSSSTEREATQTISSSEGYEIVITSTDATKPYRGATSGSNPTYYLIFGKCKSTIPVTIDLPAINGFKLTSVSVGGTSAGSTNVYMSIRDAENEVINGGTPTQYKQGESVSWTLSNTVANTSYKIYFLGNDDNTRNVQLASISLTYASAGPATYNLTYVGGDGATGDAPEEVTGKQKDAKFNLAGKNTLNKEEYKFVGWKSNVSGDTKIWAAGEEYTMPAQNVTMTAQWSSVTYTDYITECTAPTTWVVKYAVNAPEGYSGNLPSNVELDPTESFTIPTNNYLTCAHYTQIGWNTDPEATIGQSSIEAQEAGTKVTLYAVWQAKKYEVKFNDNSVISTSQESYNTQITMPALAQGCAEYTSIGWTSVAPTNNVWASQPTIINTGAQCTVTDNVTYYAVYGENSSDPNTFTKISSAAELESGATYMYIWDKNDEGSLYAMSCSYSDEDYSLAPVSVIATNNSITDNELCNRWIFTKTGTQYSIKNAQSHKYLGCDDNNLAYLEAEQTVFDITIDNSGALDIHCPSCDYDDWWGEAHLVGYISFYDEEKTFKFSSSYYDGNCYLYKGSTVSYISNPDCRTLTDIEVKTNPKVIYKEGEIFNPAGLIITATYETGDPKDIAYNDAPSSFGFAPSTDMPLTNETKVTISYGGKTCDLNITVTPLERYSVIFHNNGIEITPTTTFGPIVEGNAIGELPGVSGFDGLASCDENSPEFVGWTTAEMDEKSDTKPALVKSDFIPTNDVNLYAVWAKKTNATTAVQPNTVLAYWPKHKFDNAGDAFEATIGTGTMTSNIALTDGAGSWVYGNQNISTNPIITLSNLNLTGISNPISLSFVVKASQAHPLKIGISEDGTNYTDFFTTGNLANGEVAYTIPNIPNTTKSIKITFQNGSGAFRIGTITLKTVNASNYVYTQLTETNTADWNGSDWDGYYLIYGSDTKKALNGYVPGEKSYYDVTPTDIATIEDNDIDAAFKIEYVQDNGYTVKAMGCGKYLQPASSALNLSENPAYHSSINYNVLAGNNSYLRDNSNNFKYYAQSTQGKEITLYKILDVYTDYLTNCTPDDQCLKPTFSPVAGAYTGIKEISISCETEGADIYYTKDGNDPTTNSTKYTGAISIDRRTTIKAIAVKEDMVNSEIASAEFVISYDVTFDMQGHGEAIEPQSIEYGATIAQPTDPQTTGYIFGGWYKEESCTNSWNFTEDKVTTTTTLYAKWTVEKYTITFSDCGVIDVRTEQAYDSHITAPALTMNGCGYNHLGWTEIAPMDNTWASQPTDIVASEADITVTGTTTYYAVYSDGEEVLDGYHIYTLAGGSTKYYISGLPGTQKKMASSTTNALLFTIDKIDGTATDLITGGNYIYINTSRDLVSNTSKPNSGDVKTWKITSNQIVGNEKTRYIGARKTNASGLIEFKDTGKEPAGEVADNYTWYPITVEAVYTSTATYTAMPICPEITWMNNGAEYEKNHPNKDKKLVLPETNPEPCNTTLYEFAGWSATQPSGASWTTEPAVISANTDAPTEAATYYAVFKSKNKNKWFTVCPNFYAITYHANDGTDANYVAYTELTTSTTPTAEQAGFVKEGATLIGWTLNPNADEIEYVAPNTGLTGIDGNREYYAVWVGSIQMSAPVRLTSAKGATAGSATFTLSSQDLGTITTLRFSYKDVDNNITYSSSNRSSSEFRLCNTDYTTTGAEDNVDVTTSGVNFSKEYAIVYTPNSENKMSHYQLVVELMVKNKKMATNTFDLYGRSLPDQFVIAENRDNKWYALPANINDEAKARAGVEITVSGEGLNMGAFASENELYTLKTYNHDESKVLFQSTVNNGHLWAASGDGTGIRNYATTISGQNNPYAWILTPTDETLLTYRLGNVNNNRTLAMNGTNFGMYSSFGTNTVYFLPLKTITELIEVEDGESRSLSEYEVDENTTVIVHAGGVLNADKEATIGTLQIEKTGDKSGQVFETATLTANNAYFDLTLNAQGMKWYDIAVPFTVDRLQGLSLPDGNKIPLNDVLVYNGTARATNGANGSAWQYQDDGDLIPGVGYDIMFASNVTTVRFTKKADAQLNNENKELAVSEFASSNPLDANWNYVANNSLHYVNLGFEKEENKDVVAQTYVPVSDSYTPYAQNEATYLVGTPFFVQVAADKVVWNIDETHSVLRAPAMTTNRVERFTLEMSANGEMTDRLFVSADENARNEYQIGKDVAKMGVSSTVAQMWIDNYNTKLCANEAILYNGTATYQMGIFIPKEGEYTIAITNAPENATLYLTIDGLPIWNLSESAYVANLTKGTHTEFGLLLQANMQSAPTNINSLNGNNKAQKIFKDQNIYILRDAQMYNTQGVKVQ